MRALRASSSAQVEAKACSDEADAWWAGLTADDERWRKRQETSGADELMRIVFRGKVGAATTAAVGEKRKRGE